MGLMAAAAAPGVLKWGAFAFGALVGWNAYFINRYRKDVLIGDLAGIIGAVGGGAVLTLFPAESVTFGYYGLGLALGFFGYLALMVVLVAISPEATVSWILFGQAGARTLEEGDGEPPPGPPGPEREGREEKAEAGGTWQVPIPPGAFRNFDLQFGMLQRPVSYMHALHRLKRPDPPF